MMLVSGERGPPKAPNERLSRNLGFDARSDARLATQDATQTLRDDLDML
jgi:hypothetical protein